MKGFVEGPFGTALLRAGLPAQGDQRHEPVAARYAQQVKNLWAVGFLVVRDPARSQSQRSVGDQYVLRRGATVFRIVPRVPTHDCNAHGRIRDEFPEVGQIGDLSAEPRSVTTTNSQGCMLFAEGASLPASTIWRIRSSSTGLELYDGQLWRERIAVKASRCVLPAMLSRPGHGGAAAAHAVRCIHLRTQVPHRMMGHRSSSHQDLAALLNPWSCSCGPYSVPPVD